MSPDKSNRRSARAQTQSLWLAIEGGGSKTRVMLAQTDGRMLAESVLGPANPLYIERAAYTREIGRSLAAVRAVAQKHHGAVSSAGLAAPMDEALIKRLIRAEFGRVRVMKFTEGEIALAFCGLEWGMVLVAGTGSSCHFVSRAGRIMACGGCGPQFGDEGSAYWIGREAIAAAMRAEYGGGEKTILNRRLREFFGIPSMWSILTFADAGGHVSAHRVAASAPIVTQCAIESDRIARDIMSRAAVELADLVVRTSKAAGIGQGRLPLVLSGGVFRARELVLRPLRAHVRRHLKAEVKFAGPVLEPAPGIFRLIKRRLG